MATSALFGILDALVALLPATMPTGVQVFDGYVDQDVLPASGLIVGIPDPTDDGAATSVTAQQAWANTGHTTREERGEVFCVAWATDGANSATTARASVQAILSAVENLLRTNYQLGLGASVVATGFGSNVDLQQDQDDSGALAQVTFSIAYQARI